MCTRVQRPKATKSLVCFNLIGQFHEKICIGRGMRSKLEFTAFCHKLKMDPKTCILTNFKTDPLSSIVAKFLQSNFFGPHFLPPAFHSGRQQKNLTIHSGAPLPLIYGKQCKFQFDIIPESQKQITLI